MTIKRRVFCFSFLASLAAPFAAAREIPSQHAVNKILAGILDAVKKAVNPSDPESRGWVPYRGYWLRFTGWKTAANLDQGIKAQWLCYTKSRQQRVPGIWSAAQSLKYTASEEEKWVARWEALNRLEYDIERFLEFDGSGKLKGEGFGSGWGS